MPEEPKTTGLIPQTLVAVKCTQCNKLIPETDEYLHVLNVRMNQILKRGGGHFRGHRKFQLGIENAVFCNVTCFCQHVQQEERTQTI